MKQSVDLKGDELMYQLKNKLEHNFENINNQLEKMEKDRNDLIREKD